MCNPLHSWTCCRAADYPMAYPSPNETCTPSCRGLNQTLALQLIATLCARRFAPSSCMTKVEVVRSLCPPLICRPNEAKLAGEACTRLALTQQSNKLTNAPAEDCAIPTLEGLPNSRAGSAVLSQQPLQPLHMKEVSRHQTTKGIAIRLGAVLH